MLKMVMGMPKTMADAGAFAVIEEVKQEAPEEEGDPALNRMAKEIFLAADRQSVNGRVTMTELQGNLINTKHHKFMQFMMRDRAKAFKMFDTDGSYTLSLSELKAGVKAFLTEEASPQEPQDNPVSADWWKYNLDKGAAMNRVTALNASSISNTFAAIMGLDPAVLRAFEESRQADIRDRASVGLATQEITRAVVERRRGRYMESTTAYRRRLNPCVTTCKAQLSSGCAMGSSSWWEPRFPEPEQPPLPGMERPKPRAVGFVPSPWDHPPTQAASGVGGKSYDVTPARCATPHLLRHPRAPRARGSRWVLEGVIKQRSRSVMGATQMEALRAAGSYGNEPMRPFKNLKLPALPRAAVSQYNRRIGGWVGQIVPRQVVQIISRRPGHTL